MGVVKIKHTDKKFNVQMESSACAKSVFPELFIHSATCLLFPYSMYCKMLFLMADLFACFSVTDSDNSRLFYFPFYLSVVLPHNQINTFLGPMLIFAID